MIWTPILYVTYSLVAISGTAHVAATRAEQEIATCMWNIHMSKLERFAQSTTKAHSVTYEEEQAAEFLEQVTGMASPVRHGLSGAYVLGRDEMRRAVERWKIWYALYGRTIYFDSARGVVRSPRAVQAEN